MPVAALLAVYACSFAILHSRSFEEAPTVFSAAIAFDLTITTSLLVWWFGVRRARWPRWTLGAVFGGGLLVARTVLPDPDVALWLLVIWGLVEISIVGLAVVRIRTILRVVRTFDGPGPVAALEAGLAAARVPSRIAALIATDIVAIWLGLGGWFRRARAGYTMHRTTGWIAILGVMLGLIAVETVLVHILVDAWWGALPAWILSALSIYSALWLAADLHAVRLYPLRVCPDFIELSVGIRWRCTIPRWLLVRVDRVSEAPKGALDAGVISPNLALVLAQPIEIRGLFGITRRRDVIAITIDDPDRFLSEVT